MEVEKKGIAGSVYDLLLEKKILGKRDKIYFFEGVFERCLVLHDKPNKLTAFYKYDFAFNDGTDNGKNEKKLIIESLTKNKRKILLNIRTLLGNSDCIIQKSLNSIIEDNNQLQYAIRDTRKELPSDNDKREYDKNLLQRLIYFFRVGEQTTERLSYNIYLLMFLSFSKTLPEDFFFGPNYDVFLDEFNREINMKYGVCSRPGINKLKELAERKMANPIILYTYGDLLFIGVSEYSIEKNYDLCYQMWKYAGGVNLLSDDHSFSHPLALFSLAFLIMKYDQMVTKPDPSSNEYIPEISAMSSYDRYKAAALYAVAGYTMYADKGDRSALANTLGNICLVLSIDVPGIKKIRDEYKIKNAVAYFNEAIEVGEYAYSFNNMAKIYFFAALACEGEVDKNVQEYLSCAFETNDINKIIHDTFGSSIDVKKAKAKFLEKIREYLEKIAETEREAANRLGIFYARHEISYPNFNKTIKEPYKITGISLSLPEATYREKAKHFYQLAMDKQFAWGYANCYEDFPEMFEKESEGDPQKQEKHPDKEKFKKLYDVVFKEGASDGPKKKIRTLFNKHYGLDIDVFMA